MVSAKHVYVPEEFNVDDKRPRISWSASTLAAVVCGRAGVEHASAGARTGGTVSHSRLCTTLSCILNGMDVVPQHVQWYQTDRLYKAGLDFYHWMRKQGYFVLSLESAKYLPGLNLGGTWDVVYVRLNCDGSYSVVVCDYKSSFVPAWGQSTCFQLCVHALLLHSILSSEGSPTSRATVKYEISSVCPPDGLGAGFQCGRCELNSDFMAGFRESLAVHLPRLTVPSGGAKVHDRVTFTPLFLMSGSIAAAGATLPPAPVVNPRVRPARVQYSAVAKLCSLAAQQARYSFALVQVLRARRALLVAIVRVAKTPTSGLPAVDLSSTRWKVELSGSSREDVELRKTRASSARFVAGFTVTQYPAVVVDESAAVAPTTAPSTAPTVFTVSVPKSTDHVALAFVFACGWNVADWDNETSSVVWRASSATSVVHFPWERETGKKNYLPPRCWDLCFDSQKVGTWSLTGAATVVGLSDSLRVVLTALPGTSTSRIQELHEMTVLASCDLVPEGRKDPHLFTRLAMCSVTSGIRSDCVPEDSLRTLILNPLLYDVNANTPFNVEFGSAVQSADESFQGAFR